MMDHQLYVTRIKQTWEDETKVFRAKISEQASTIQSYVQKMSDIQRRLKSSVENNKILAFEVERMQKSAAVGNGVEYDQLLVLHQNTVKSRQEFEDNVVVERKANADN